MLSMIVGREGSGKTKKLVELLDKICKNCKGNIVFIERGDALKFNIDHDVRLIDIRNYSIHDFDVLYGFICGICESNYDVSNVFLDTVIGVAQENLHEFEVFTAMLKDLSERVKVNFYMAVSINMKYIPNFISRENLKI